MTTARISRVWGTIILTITICLVSFPAYAKYSGGTGEPDDPYQIATAEDLLLLGKSPEDYDKHFVLTDDIDLDPNLPGRKVFDKAVIAPEGATPFTGIFDGNGHTIRNADVNIPKTDYVGLFGWVGDDGQIRNLGIEEITINADDYVGSLVGKNCGRISACHAVGSVTGGGGVGGLVGYNAKGVLVDCHFVGQVAGSGSDVGGLLGHNDKGTLTTCDAAGSASGNEKVGGLAGASSTRSTISDCNADVDVLGHRYVGGLVGYDDGSISNSCATGRVQAEGRVGGLVGEIANSTISGCCATGDVVGITKYAGGLVGAASQGSTITNCYANGDVSADSRVGGLVGASNAVIQNAYASGKVSASAYVGGLAGTSGDWVTDCFWDVQTSGLNQSAAGEGKTTAEMRNLDTFIEWACSAPGIWTIDDENDYPRLAWQILPGQVVGPPQPQGWYDGGEGTPEDPYRIATARHLWIMGMYPCDWDRHFVLVTDVNLADYSGPAFRTIGRLGVEGDPTNKAFDGVFDGNDHAIHHFARSYAGAGCVGLFGWLGQAGQIKNLSMEGVDVDAEKGLTLGGLAGVSYGTISNCCVSGTVSGKSLVGGLVGSNWLGHVLHCRTDVQANNAGLVGWNGGEISDSSTAGRVTGVYEVGGLVARNDGTISRCRAIGDVSGNRRVGGLVGANATGAITDSCASGRVSGNIGAAGGLVGLVGWDSGPISGCYATGDVQCGEEVGGLVGCHNGGQISDSYATGHVQAQQCAGGLIGTQNRGAVLNSYATGYVSGQGLIGALVGRWDGGSITDCFWDSEASGQSATVGVAGTPKTTSEMQTAKTFLDAGWDFVDETTNGTDDIWWIDEGQDYPRLWWEASN